MIKNKLVNRSNILVLLKRWAIISLVFLFMAKPITIIITSITESKVALIENFSNENFEDKEGEIIDVEKISYKISFNPNIFDNASLSYFIDKNHLLSFIADIHLPPPESNGETFFTLIRNYQ